MIGNGKYMKIKKKDRKFKTGLKKKIEINHKADIFLNNNEMITFILNQNKSYDITKKDWGLYISQSINHRVINNGFRIAFIKNKKKRKYLVAVDLKNKKKFNNYCKKEGLISSWVKQIC